MTVAEWNNQKWGTDRFKVRGIEAISLSCEAHTVTDSATNSTKCNGRSLEKLQITFSTALATGGSPYNEQQELEKLTGSTAPFYCGEEQIGDNDFILEAVNLQNGKIDAYGKLLTANFSLSFIEDAKEQEINGAEKNKSTKDKETKLKITMEGKDIADKISVKNLFYKEFACNHSDVLELHFNDTSKNWDKWEGGKLNGKEIFVEYGKIKTGKMFITSCKPEQGIYILRAMSIPASYNSTTTKSWEKISLEELAKEIASNHGLSFKSYDTKNKKRKYIQQDNKGDFTFLSERCDLEGASFVVFDGVLNLYDEQKLENEKGSAEIDIDDERTTSAGASANINETINKYEVKNGRYKGSAEDSNGKLEIVEVISEPVESDDEAKGIASALLRNKNKGANVIEVKTDLREDISAGSCINIKTEKYENWRGNVFVYKVMHNLIKNKTSIWARKPLNY